MTGDKKIRNYNNDGTNISFASALNLSSEAALKLRSNNTDNNAWYIGLDGSMTGSAGNHISASATSTGSLGSLKVDGASVDFSGLPTSDPGIAGRLWNDSNTVKISAW